VLSASILSAVGLLFAAAITPGPNNFIVLDAGARGGAASAARAISGVITGSIALLALACAGMAPIVGTVPAANSVLAVAGAAYLACLGIGLVVRAGSTRDGSRSAGLPQSFVGVATFQLLNPKAWVLVTTLAASLTGAREAAVLLGAMIIVTGLCLTAWAVAGSLLSEVLSGPARRVWFDRAMGALLVGSAGCLAVEALAR